MLLFSPNCWAKVNLEADNVQYLKKDNLIVAEGNTHLQSEQMNLWADYLKIDLENNQLTAEGEVRVVKQGEEIRSEKLNYNLKLAEGVFINSESIIVDESLNGELYLNSPQINYTADKSTLEDAESTSCDNEDPHYHLSSSSVAVYPGDKIIAYNNFIWEFGGHIPILYSPIWIYSLKNDKQILEQEIGHSEIRGWYLKNTYNYYLDNDYDNFLLEQLTGDQGQLYLDYFENTGWAFGFKHYYHYLQNRHAFLYLYTEQDKLNPSYSPWLEVELDSYLRRPDLTRKYNLQYSDHEDDYWTNPEKTTDIDFEFSQNNDWQEWTSDLDFDYNKSSAYNHKTNLALNFEGEISEDEELEIDLNHNFEENEFSYYNNNIERNYEVEIEYDKQLSEEHYNDDLELDLGFDYDDSRQILKEYDLDFAFKKHISDLHYVDYQYTYDNPLDRVVIEDNYLAEIDEEKTGQLHSLILGKDKGRSFYDWELKTKSFQQDSELGYYYLPEGELTLYPGSIWRNRYLDNLEVSLGGANKYASSWGHKEQNGYYQLDYYDVMSAPLNNSVIIDQNFQQDYYSTGESRWFHESR
ncbi:MAG: hypothetical protein ACQERJ_10535, partial [Bacillota bacterium]